MISKLFKRILPLLAAFPMLCSCVEEALQPEKGFSLYFPAISEIAPGTNINVTPTWYGGTPTEFAISSVKLDSAPVSVDWFSVNPETGVFNITGSDDAETGVYTIGISCVVDGRTHNFPEALCLEMMKPVPDGIVVEPSELTVKLVDVMTTGKDIVLPTAKISSDGSNHVEIKEYLIANVYLDGNPANEYKDWFSISEDGVFSIVPNNPDFESGLFEFDFKLVTYIVGKSSEKGIFPKALKLDVISAPARVTYTPSSSKVEQGVTGKSPAPAFKGSRSGLKYAVKSVSPNNNAGISVDASTGVLTFPETASAEVGDRYSVSLSVSNDYGTTDFEDVYAFEVIAFLTPITDFAYADISEVISGVSFTNPVTRMDGDDVTYSFVNLPAVLSPLTIDISTGLVSCPKGVELPVGNHTVTVRAENAKGHVDASFKVNVIANPNYFTYVRWGNNIGPNGTTLTPIAKYGNQFRVFHGGGTLKFNIVESDIPEGRPVKFEGVKPATANGSISVNTTNGRIDVYGKAAGTTQNTISFTVVHVTVGEGEAAITRKFPVFADLCGAQAGHTILYTPFAIRYNPKTGGVSEAPVITNSVGDDVTAGCSLDFQTNQCYYNINGPESHGDPTMLKNDNAHTTFLYHIWKRYLDAFNKAWNAYSVDPMSWWNNYEKGTLDYCAGYVDGADGLKIRINPEKFVDPDGNYADGAMYMTMLFRADGKNPQTASDKTQVNRVLLWFDPSYNPADYE